MKESNGSVAAIVLAAGESKRMGTENKLLLPYKSRPVLVHVVEALVHSQAASVYVVVGHEQDRIREVVSEFPVEIIENLYYEEGMGTSIRVGVQEAIEDVEGYMICLSDLPLITPDEYSHLAQMFLSYYAHNQNAILVPRYQGQRGNPVVLSVNYRAAMLAQQGVMGCRGIVKQHPEHVMSVEMDTDHIVYDIDTPEAYQVLIEREGSSK